MVSGDDYAAIIITIATTTIIIIVIVIVIVIVIIIIIIIIITVIIEERAERALPMCEKHRLRHYRHTGDSRRRRQELTQERTGSGSRLPKATPRTG
ncbi:hypothetical protein SKAU_G00079140 [Synaphobranchus kaupii]|uniref:Uncharacterized protein n=1 Tax=Synaphobranchus kaupii TaxID=118154 RepID=A0A9Q1FUI2_SYNKA|nr:hypothetical protein SKAU_G00079140 [Synaphobranchus kaupii]